jgi:flagellar export protein FliJ
MSGALSVLLRLHRDTMERVQIELAEIVNQRVALAAEEAAHRHAIAKEQSIAQAQNVSQTVYGAFAHRSVQDLRARAVQDDHLRREEDRLRADLAAAHVEVKKLEHLMEQQALRERVAQNAAEMAAFDEAAIVGVWRTTRER